MLIAGEVWLHREAAISKLIRAQSEKSVFEDHGILCALGWVIEVITLPARPMNVSLLHMEESISSLHEHYATVVASSFIA